MDVDHEPPAYTSGMNVNKPDLYHGERSKLDDWLMQWDLFFTFQGEKVPEIKRVVLVASYMRGKAFQWIKPFVQQYQAGEAPDEVDEWMRDFDAFKERIKPIFGVSNEPTIARRNIQRIKQEKSAADYAAEFQQLAANTDWDDTALMTMFRQGLKPKVKEELMRTGASVETLDSLINTSIDIDVRLQELQQELRDDPRARAVLVDRRPPPRNPWRNNFNRGQRGGHYQSNTGRRIHQNTNSGYHGPEAMDLSNINKGPDRWNKDRSKGSKPDKSKVTCYGCGKQGHFARDCRMKNKVVRQLNMLTTGDEGTGDEWEILTDDIGRPTKDDHSAPDNDDTKGPKEDAKESIDPYNRAPTPYQDEQGRPLTRARKFRDPQTGQMRMGYEPDSPEANGVTYPFKSYVEIETPPQPPKKLRFPPKAYPNARDSTIPVRIEEDGTWVYNTSGTHVGDGFVIDTPRRRTRQELYETRDCRTDDKVVRQLNVLTGTDADASEEWEVLTDDMGCLMEDTESEYDDAQDYIPDEERFDRAPTPHREFFEPVATRAERQGRRNRRTKIQRNGVGHWVERAEQEAVDAGVIVRTQPCTYQNSATQTKENEPVLVVSPQPQYDLDLRNMKHGLRSWTACPYDHCPIHYDAKVGSGWFPSLKTTCKLMWYDCKKDMCEVHLWDKRSKLHFPGTDDPQRIIQMQLVVNGSCYNVHWQHCLNQDCDLHRDSKYNNGFGDEEPFLGLRLRAPGIDPSIPQGPIHSSSSPSY
jgi:hypothetical protein